LLRRVVTCAVGVGIVALAAACSPVKMGAAAIVGSDRITVTQLDDQVSAYEQVYPKYASAVQVTSSKVPSEVLAWLIRFQIRDQLAADSGITVTPAQVQTAINEINVEGKAYASESGVSDYSLDLLLVANGLAPDLVNELGRYQAIENEYLTKANGGTSPSSTSQENAATKKMTKAECSAAESLDVQVSPQFGTFDYSEYSVSATPDLLSAASGAKPSKVSSGSC